MTYKSLIIIIILTPALVLCQWKTPKVSPIPISFDTAIVGDAIYISVLSFDSIFVLPARTQKGMWTTVSQTIAEIDSIPKGNGVLYYNRDFNNASSIGLKIMDAVGKKRFKYIFFTNTKPPSIK